MGDSGATVQPRKMMGEDGAEDKLSLRFHVVTWNMNYVMPDLGLSKSLLRHPRDERSKRCVYAIGVQEGSQSDVWVDLIRQELGNHFLLVGEGNIGGIHLVVFVTNDIVEDFEFEITTDVVSCGIGNIYWNKGAVAFLLNIGSFKALLVNSHMAAHQDKVQERNNDFHRIRSELFKSRQVDRSRGIESVADVVFWFGDFNYRIEGNRKSVEYLLKKKMMNVLLANDQLLMQKKEKLAFDE